uniref:CSON011681 protein n=1 Tax=Culicoides sonorensis TaxID=179676 RepID=A0A336KJT5_CULSO
MRYNATYQLIFSLLIIIIAAESGNALKCWKCSTDTNGEEFCHDPFESYLIDERQRRWSYVDCTFPMDKRPYGMESKQGCKKIKQITHDKVVIKRSCSWEDSCPKKHNYTELMIEFCGTCSTDGCNGASEYELVLLFLIIPAIIIMFLL